MQTSTHPRPSRKFHRKSGFTLIEILIVIALIAGLAAFMIGGATDTLVERQKDIANTFVNSTLKTALVTYRIDNGSYPTTEQGLKALIAPPSGKEKRWRGPYLETEPIDPFGNPYQYKYPGTRNISGSKGYDAWSLGPDGTEGTEDDIGNWE